MSEYQLIIEDLENEKATAWSGIGLSENLAEAAYEDGKRVAFEKAIKIVKERFNEKQSCESM